MEAIHIAAGKIAMGSGKAFICGGVESMTRVRTGFEPLPYPYSDAVSYTHLRAHETDSYLE